MTMTEGVAQLHLGEYNVLAQDASSTDVFAFFVNQGLPLEFSTRLLEDLWGKTKIVAGEVIHIGKIIILKIVEFIKENPHMSVGTAIGAAVYVLINAIPYIGPFVAPLIGGAAIITGMAVGSLMDMASKGQKIDPSFLGLTQAVINSAKKFFELIIDIFLILKVDFEERFCS